MAFRNHMDKALDQARAAAGRGEVPVGAVLLSPSNRILSGKTLALIRRP